MGALQKLRPNGARQGQYMRYQKYLHAVLYPGPGSGRGLMKTGKVWKLDPSTQGRLVYSSFALPMLRMDRARVLRCTGACSSGKLPVLAGLHTIKQ